MSDDQESAHKPDLLPIKRERVEPGWYSNEVMDNERYHRGTLGTSSSKLKTLLEQTAAYCDYKNSHPKDPTAAMELGTAVHTMVLEPHRVDHEIVVEPEDINKRTNAGKAEYAAWVENNANKIILTRDRMEQAQEMAMNVRNHPTAKLLLEGAIVESSVFWWYDSMDPDDNTPYREMVKVRPDFLPVAYPLIGDLKTSTDATFTTFSEQCTRMHYDLSAAMYMEGVNQCQPIIDATKWFARLKFVFVVVESEPPYQVACYEMDSDFMQLGILKYRMAMEKLYRARRDKWPSFPEEIRILSAPRWAHKGHIV